MIVIFCGQFVYIIAFGRMPRIVVVVAVGMSYGIMRARLVVLKLVGVVFLQRRVEIFLLVCSARRLANTHVYYGKSFLLLTQ